jgi:hypothetical protein
VGCILLLGRGAKARLYCCHQQFLGGRTAQRREASWHSGRIDTASIQALHRSCRVAHPPLWKIGSLYLFLGSSHVCAYTISSHSLVLPFRRSSVACLLDSLFHLLGAPPLSFLRTLPAAALYRSGTTLLKAPSARTTLAHLEVGRTLLFCSIGSRDSGSKQQAGLDYFGERGHCMSIAL